MLYVVRCLNIGTGEITYDDFASSFLATCRDCEDFNKHNPGFWYSPVPTKENQ